ncbi:hypothetical protein ONZ51_g1523 [Trametes cubensis]|uniref:Uncharacterized protein n=1 Tax=Trametes cubensis TaxID=1111947 RepID=A0AAD7U1C0_9APHY|nr:hypothetical protein ONZ51_g1523 [Trametes cubensis]
MVARNSKKRAKYTYAERVLGALSDIQKEQRKHAVHMATLRAHVRKMADARKDKMGPQWAQWVSRTVNKLADDGILDTSDPHGNVTFTPNAKKTITKVRRESMGPGVVFSPGLERKIWKDVTRRFSGVGVKRPRWRSSAVHPLTQEADDWDDVDSPPRKRQARKSLSKLTKAELEAELHAAQKRLQDAQELQPVNAEELAVLQEVLSEREKEVAALREELANLKAQHSTIDDRVTVGTSTRMFTPPPTNTSLLSSPPPSLRTTTDLRSRHAAHGVTRTLSGSLISNISKQPTPEPSDAGSQESEIDELIFDEMEDAPMSAFPEVEQGVFSRPPQVHGLATPQSSPLLADQEDFGSDLDVQEVPQEYDVGIDAEEVIALKDKLEAQSAELDRLRDEHRRVSEERDELRASLVSRDGRLKNLESDLLSSAEALSQSRADKTELERTLALETARRREAEDTLATCQSALASQRQRCAGFEGKVAGLQAACEALETQVHGMGSHSEQLARELEATRTEASDWRARRLECEEELRRANTELADVKQQLRSTHTDYEELKKALKLSETTLVGRSAELEQTTAALAKAQDDLVQTRLNLGSARAAQETMATRIAELEHDLEGTREQSRSLIIEKDALEHVAGDLQETVKQLREELSHAKANMESMSNEVQQSQVVISGLRASKDHVVHEAAALKVTVSELELTVDKLRAEVEDAAAEAANLRRDVEMEQASRRVAESELISTKATCDKLVSDLADKTVRLSSALEDLAVVRRAEADLRCELEAAKEQHAQELAAGAAERSALEADLKDTRAMVVDLEDQLQRLTTQFASVSEELVTATGEKERLAAELEESTQRCATLEEDLKLTRSDLEEAEEEIAELRRAKAEDEASIQNLKSGLSRLRQLQMDALNEVDSKTLKFEVEGTHHDNAASRRDNQGGHGTRAVFHSDDVTTGGSPVDSHMRALWPESSQTHFLRAATAFIADAGAYHSLAPPMFRLPTHLESLVPPPGDQVPHSQPWRGAFILPASSPHSSARPREIFVTAAETENDNQQEQWPSQFQLQIIRRGGILGEVQAWLSQLQPEQLSRCMLMPDRLPDADLSRQNQTTFEWLARQLLEEGIVAIAPWGLNTEPLHPGGILLYPTRTTRALLVGIVFLNTHFPEFIIGPGSHSPTAGPSSRMPPGTAQMLPRLQPFQPVSQHSLYDPAPPNISSASRYPQGGTGADAARGGRPGRHGG